MLRGWMPSPTTTPGTALLTDTATLGAGVIGAGKLTGSRILLTWNESVSKVGCSANMALLRATIPDAAAIRARQPTTKSPVTTRDVSVAKRRMERPPHERPSAQ